MIKIELFKLVFDEVLDSSTPTMLGWNTYKFHLDGSPIDPVSVTIHDIGKYKDKLVAGKKYRMILEEMQR